MPLDVALRGEEEVNGRIHDVHADDFLDEVFVEQHRGKPDAEQDDGNRLLVIDE